MRSIRTRRLTSLLLGLAWMALATGEATAQFSDNPRLPTPQGNFVQGDQPCPCQDGHWYDKNRKSCVTGSCKVPGMPNGDKGGKYFAWDGNLFIDTPCKPCERLVLPLATGTAAWVFADGPVPSMKGKPPVVHTQIPAGWGSLPGSSWVTATTSGTAPEDHYTYELRFCLCPGFSNAGLAMSVLADNSAMILLNGNQIGAISGPEGVRQSAEACQHEHAVLLPAGSERPVSARAQRRKPDRLPGRRPDHGRRGPVSVDPTGWSGPARWRRALPARR